VSIRVNRNFLNASGFLQERTLETLLIFFILNTDDEASN